MTKNEFMTRLISELHKRNVADSADVAEEYEQHFAFKLADGYSEEEIAARLGVPEELAAQFESAPNTAPLRRADMALAELGRPVFRHFRGAAAVLRYCAGFLCAELRADGRVPDRESRTATHRLPAADALLVRRNSWADTIS